MIRIKQLAMALLLAPFIGTGLEAKLDGKTIINQADKALQSGEVSKAVFNGVQMIVAVYFNEIAQSMSEEDRKEFFEVLALMVELNHLKLAQMNGKDKTELAKIEQMIQTKSGILSVKMLPLMPYLDQWKEKLEQLISSMAGIGFVCSGHPNVFNSN